MNTLRVRKEPNSPFDDQYYLADLYATLDGAGLSSHHGVAGASALITAADASDLATSKTLAQAIAVAFQAHSQDGSATPGTAGLHSGVDATLASPFTGYTSYPGLPADLTEVQAVANGLKGDFNTHIANAAVHRSTGGISANVCTVTAATATDQATSNTLLNAIKRAFNAHAQMGVRSIVVD